MPARRPGRGSLRYPAFTVWSAFWLGCGLARSRHRLTDWTAFEGGARVLLSYHHLQGYSGGALHLYANYPYLQIGPPALLPLLPWQWADPRAVAVAFAALMAALGVAAVGCAEHAAGGPRRAAATVLGGLAVTAVWSYDAGSYRHLDDVLALSLALAAAVVVARQGPWWLAGLLLGTACATKPWAVVLTPVLLGLPRRDRARTVLAVLAAGAVWWVPFVVAAPRTLTALADYHLVPGPGSVLHLLGVHGDASRWLRPAQALAGVTAGTAAALRQGWRAAPLAGLAGRVALEPYAFAYYGVGPVAAALLWDLSRRRRRLPWWTLGTLVAEYAVPALAPAAFAAAGRLAWVVAAVVGACLFRDSLPRTRAGAP